MTHVNRSSVRREVSTRRGDALVVLLTPDGIYLREKGRRTAFLLEYGFAYQLAAKMEAEAQVRARKAEKLARRKLTARSR